jgi:hypothetical protein
VVQATPQEKSYRPKRQKTDPPVAELMRHGALELLMRASEFKKL